MAGVSSRLVLSIGLVVIAVGMVDSFLGAEWDLFVVFALAGSLQLILWIRQRARRRPVTLRPDLANWLERRSERVGEPFDDMLDRAVAHYKHGLYADSTQVE